jgi:hypothetical protein
VEWVTANPVALILPTILVVAWIVLWLVRRPVWPWFFVAAAILAVLCFPAGVQAARAELDGLSCTPDNLCFSADEIDWWVNGALGLVTIGGLALLTLLVDVVLPLFNRKSADPAAQRRP